MAVPSEKYYSAQILYILYLRNTYILFCERNILQNYECVCKALIKYLAAALFGFDKMFKREFLLRKFFTIFTFIFTDPSKFGRVLLNRSSR